MPLLVENLSSVLDARTRPTVVMWNRLEGRPRVHSFERALRAEVRDALWFLTRQWQLGEFLGDDAGAPLGVQLHLESARLDRYAAADQSSPYDDGTPLESVVERQPVAFLRGSVKLHLDLRLELGRHFAKLLSAAGLNSYVPAYRQKYPFALPPEDRSAAATDVYAHIESWQELSAVAGRALDGGDLYLYLRVNATHRASDGIPLSNPAHAAKLDALGARLVSWFDALYQQPGPQAKTAWQPERLEHAFTCGAPLGASDRTLVADQYPGGHLDWYSFDLDKIAPAPAGDAARRAAFQETKVASFLPAPISFDGMPNTRWWKFEEGKVSFGDLSPATTDLAKLLLVEFALVYANDWFLVPVRLPAGSLTTVAGMTVTNSFGERFWIDAAGAGLENAWQSFRMFNLSARGSVQADSALFLAPAVPKIQEGRPLDEVFMMRDEMANMVWGLETRVPLITGASNSGHEAARETAAYHQRKVAAVQDAEPYRAPIYYQAMTSVPENWIPFVPVHRPGSKRQIQLQRGGMLRLIEGDSLPKPAKIEPATAILRTGLDQKQSLFIHEEEVPRSGARVTRSFQRTRWRDGRTFVWLGMSKQNGRGEGQSHLAFDQIATKPPKS